MPFWSTFIVKVNINFHIKKYTQGFTLIELLVVISIISLLSSIALASLSGARAKARDAKRISDIKQVELALLLYYEDNGMYPGLDDSNGTVIIDGKDLLPPVPVNPWNGEYDHDYGLIYAKLSPYLSQIPYDPEGNSGSRIGLSEFRYFSYAWRGDRQAYHLGVYLETPVSSILDNDADFCSNDDTPPDPINQCGNLGALGGYRHYFNGLDAVNPNFYDIVSVRE